MFVEGRGDVGRTSVLTQTDLLLSHNIRLEGSQQLRLELNVINLFNQKTATHIFDKINRERRQSSAIVLSSEVSLLVSPIRVTRLQMSFSHHRQGESRTSFRLSHL